MSSRVTPSWKPMYTWLLLYCTACVSPSARIANRRWPVSCSQPAALLKPPPPAPKTDVPSLETDRSRMTSPTRENVGPGTAPVVALTLAR